MRPASQRVRPGARAGSLLHSETEAHYQVPPGAMPWGQFFPDPVEVCWLIHLIMEPSPTLDQDFSRLSYSLWSPGHSVVPITIAGSVQYPGLICSTSFTQLIGSSPTADSHQLTGSASGLLSVCQALQYRSPGFTSGLQAHDSTSACQPVGSTGFLLPSSSALVLSLLGLSPFCQAPIVALVP